MQVPSTWNAPSLPRNGWLCFAGLWLTPIVDYGIIGGWRLHNKAPACLALSPRLPGTAGSMWNPSTWVTITFRACGPRSVGPEIHFTPASSYNFVLIPRSVPQLQEDIEKKRTCAYGMMHSLVGHVQIQGRGTEKLSDQQRYQPSRALDL